MGYTAPLGSAIEFRLVGFYAKPAANALDFSFAPKGVGAATFVLSADGAGTSGAACSANIVLDISVFGEGWQDTIGAGAVLFASDIAAGLGYVMLFGDGRATPAFAAVAKGIVGILGAATGQVSLVAEAVGGTTTYAAAAIVLPLIGVSVGSVPRQADTVTGQSSVSLPFSVQGAGRSEPAAVGTIAALLVASGAGKHGVSGRSEMALTIRGSGVARRGATGYGFLSLRCSAQVHGGIGVAGPGEVSFMTATGRGDVVGLVSGVGGLAVRFSASGWGERPIDFTDAGLDVLFVRTRPRNSFIMAA